MRIVEFDLPIFDWNVKLIEVHKDDYFKDVMEECNYFGKKHVKCIKRSLKIKSYDGGLHLYDLSKRRSLVMIYPSSSDEERLSTIGHEKRHLEDRIIQYYSINDIETAGFLAGYLTKKLF